jgi:hypothetical protein
MRPATPQYNALYLLRRSQSHSLSEFSGFKKFQKSRKNVKSQGETSKLSDLGITKTPVF